MNPAIDWLEARIEARARQIGLCVGRDRGIGSVYVRPMIEIIPDLHSDRADGYVCRPMHVDCADYEDPERRWL